MLKSIHDKFITELELKEIAPSVFAVDQSANVSHKYTQIPTIDIVKGFNSIGYGVVKASQSVCRDENKKAHVKHMLRLRNIESREVGGIHPEIVLVNSHDGKSSYQLRAGIYRLVCSNGMIVGNDLFSHRVRHQGDILKEVIDGSLELIQRFPEVIDTVNRWKSIQLDNHARLAFADAAMGLRWDETMNMPSSNLLTHKRRVDESRDLWTTFNVVQENIIRGKQRYHLDNNRGRQSTRAVTSVSENQRLNTALWKLAEALERQVA